MEKVIKVENLSKAYQIGEFSTGTLSNDLERWWALMRGKEDPFLKIGETNVRSAKGESNVVWSLKDLNFEVEHGDAVGLIGKNGAGKSTLLKIISQVTTPTTGTIKTKGRVASLLEVGTGFHPELTGRENIYLNGAILGMRKSEVRRNFDEIVDFSGVERYIDTPVKRYSSGMYVRLAFAVAAHLESEILIIDEVLAVGDGEFQKKCLGKLNEVSTGQGRTVLFVSHNLTSIKALCKKTIILDNGNLLEYGQTKEVVDKYLAQHNSDISIRKWDIDNPSSNGITLKKARVYARGNMDSKVITTSDELVIEFDFQNEIPSRNIDITLDVFDNNFVHVAHIGMVCNPTNGLEKGDFRTQGIFPANLLNSTRYLFNVSFGLNQRDVLLKYSEILTVDIEDEIRVRGTNFSKLPGVIHPLIEWNTSKISS